MSVSTHLELPFVAAAQSQKHVTVNDAFARLDVIVEANALDKDLGAPPASPAVGDRYIVGPGASGDWVGHEDEIASYDGSGWVFLPPQPGWKAWVQDEAELYVFHGTTWTQLVTGDVTEVELRDGSIDRVGVNAAADLTNRLAVKSDAVLLDHDGTDSRVKVNKAAAGNVASHLFQRGYSGRAELGLIGDDDFTLKVSADGTNFVEAFKVDRTTSAVDFNVPPRVNGELLGLEDGRFGQTINAYDYGLRESASAATNTAALNAASDALRAAITGIGVTSQQYIGASVYVPPGVYNIAAKATGNVGWDLSGIGKSLVRFQCEGAVFLADATLANKTVIDCIGSRFFVGVLPEVRAFEKANAPAIGLQFGRNVNSVSSGEHHFKNLHIRGYFTRTAVYNGNSEVCVFDHPIIFNYQATADSYAWIQDGRNVWMPITDADISGLTQDLTKPFNMNSFISGSFRKSGYDIDTNTDGPTVGSAVYLTACKSHLFINSYFVTADDAGVVMASETGGFANISFRQCHFESSQDHAVKMTVVAGTTWIGRGLQLEIVNSHTVVSLFGIDAGVAAVNIHDFDLSVRNWNIAPSSNIFDAPANVTLTGARIWLPDLTHWDDVASFQGDLITPSSWEHGGAVEFTSRPTVDNNDIYHKGDGLQQQTILLGDDAAAVITLPADSINHSIMAISTANTNSGAALVWISQAVNDTIIMGQTSNYETLDGSALTGTTGTDGKVTIGVTSGTLYLENRMGSNRTFSLSFLANR